jgi:hypothetical protein
MGAALAAFFARSKGWISFQVGKPAERRSCPEVMRVVCADHEMMKTAVESSLRGQH